ncbi:hypothetical protein FW774_05975 [Pedobacter sp. BS3]|uniref:hypothetical protein n=1 Tax=Pedobacter sp. BS3 TaxID=2567937 RepID=UPI0011EF1132|nr:hypothetical protein [Pedobacter sp. BS3]TZF84534.1 hypothetical protein FW774_05975 [Pedobacter sp. BS3]
MANRKKKVEDSSNSSNSTKLPVMRCGDCLFAEGGKTVKFKNGKTNELYDCTLKSRNGNIVLLDSDIRQPVWHNSRACQHFEIMSKTLKKRADLDKEKYHFACDGHFEILP